MYLYMFFFFAGEKRLGIVRAHYLTVISNEGRDLAEHAVAFHFRKLPPACKKWMGNLSKVLRFTLDDTEEQKTVRSCLRGVLYIPLSFITILFIPISKITVTRFHLPKGWVLIPLFVRDAQHYQRFYHESALQTRTNRIRSHYLLECKERLPFVPSYLN